jgi:TldD protein
MVSSKAARAALDAMRQELARTMKGVGLKGHKRPFFASYLLHLSEGFEAWGRYGSVFHSAPHREASLYCDVRVGSRRVDQVVDGGLRGKNPEDRESYQWLVGPQDLDPDALRYAFWRLTQIRYAEALQDYYDKQKVLVEHDLTRSSSRFSTEPRVVRLDRITDFRIREDVYLDFVSRSSRAFRAHRGVEDPYVQIRSTARTRIFVNSEGTRFITQDRYEEVTAIGWRLTKDGSRVHSYRSFHGRKPGELPTERQVREAIGWIARDLDAQAAAPPMEPYAGPALLSGIAAGLLFHEAIGHRLEGERFLSRSEGHTFAGKLGKRILPVGVDLVDDPTLARHGKTPLFGHYAIDDEGVPARRVELVKDGVLTTYLLSRNVAPGFSRSNGHGRHERFQNTMARMGNLMLQARHKKPLAELKRDLLQLVRARDLPFGIYVRHAASGETTTSLDHYEFQAFKGNPTEVYTIDAKTGKERRVRDVSFIGTPLAALQHIVAFGGEDEVDNSYCFAESGSVPVGTVAPSMLVAELELQRANRSSLRPPTLPLPDL